MLVIRALRERVSVVLSDVDPFLFIKIFAFSHETSILHCVVGKPTDACNKGSEGAGVRCIV